MTSQEIAQRAIDRSINHNEIVHIQASEEIDAELTLLCEGQSEYRVDSYTPPTTEFWGTTEDGSEWRVHTKGL